MGNGEIKTLLEDKLQKGLEPVLLEIIDESAQHHLPEKRESHFRVLIVSDKFEGLSLIKRHQWVHRLVSEQIKGKIHAFSQQTLTPEEFKHRGGRLPSSPPCVKHRPKS